MKVKFDKAALLKQRFWILSSVTAVLTLVGISYLVIYGSDEATARRKTLNAILKTPIDAKNNLASVAEIAEQAKKAQESAAKVWAEAYEAQAADFVWPDRVEKQYNFLSGLFARDIKLGKQADKKEVKDWPADTDFEMHAIVEAGQIEWIEVWRRKYEKTDKTDKEAKEPKAPKDGALEKVKLHRMETQSLTDEEGKVLAWADIIAQKGKKVTIAYQTGKYFGDHLTRQEQTLFAASYRDKDQIDDTLSMVEPVNERGDGVVQLRNWLYRPRTLPPDPKDKKFFRYVSKDWDANTLTTANFSKEAWIAQENIWIQREIYRLIKAANDDISKFRPIVEWPMDETAKGYDEELAKGLKKGYAYRFQNVNFEINLTLQADSTLKVKIMNLQPRKQKLDLLFRIVMNEKLQNARYDRAKDNLEQSVFRISADALMPKGEKVSDVVQFIKYTEKKESERIGIFGIEQVLTWETAAIKRIDNISIGSNDAAELAESHRDFANMLKNLDERGEVKPAAGDKKDDQPGKGGAPPGAGKEGAGGDRGGGVGNKTVLHHELWTDRYLDVTEQSRRLPVAVVLIIDQDHVNRVLTHFNNSKYRFLHAQVPLNHFTGSLQPTVAVGQKEGGPPPGSEGTPMNGGGGGGGGQEHETNMEIIIYGVMTLYQRFPPRPVAEKKP